MTRTAHYFHRTGVVRVHSPYRVYVPAGSGWREISRNDTPRPGQRVIVTAGSAIRCDSMSAVW